MPTALTGAERPWKRLWGAEVCQRSRKRRLTSLARRLGGGEGYPMISTSFPYAKTGWRFERPSAPEKVQYRASYGRFFLRSGQKSRIAHRRRGVCPLRGNRVCGSFRGTLVCQRLRKCNLPCLAHGFKGVQRRSGEIISGNGGIHEFLIKPLNQNLSKICDSENADGIHQHFTSTRPPITITREPLK